LTNTFNLRPSGRIVTAKQNTPLTRPELALSEAEGATLSPLTRGEGQLFVRLELLPFSPHSGEKVAGGRMRGTLALKGHCELSLP